MPLPAPLDRADAVVFDAYGTLLDVHSAVQRHAGAVGPEARTLSETWRQKQLEYSWVLSLSGRYAPFWTLTERALDYALDKHLQVDRHSQVDRSKVRADLLEAYRALDAYREVPATLEHLRRAGLKTAILSNGDTGMLDAAVKAADLGRHLDAVLSVDPAGTFKTAPAAYALATDALGVARERIVFLSSNRWDIAGAAAYGLTPVWVNRTGQPDEYPDLAPVRVIRSLDGLLT